MRLAKIPAAKRDYCAHLYLEAAKCRRENFPLVYRCAHQKHEYDLCEYDEYFYFANLLDKQLDNYVIIIILALYQD